MPSMNTSRQNLIETEYEPVTSSQKLILLLQRSVRYSYRQRCCKCCPTILCELLFPIIIILLLILSRYGISSLAEKQTNDRSVAETFSKQQCSQDFNTPPTSSNNIFINCFKFPPSYNDFHWSKQSLDDISDKTNIVFEPDRNDISKLVQLAKIRLNTLKCVNTNVWSQNSDDETDTHLLRNKTINTVIVDFSATSDLKNERNLAYNIIVRTPNTFITNDPIDRSFISYKHPAYIADRSNITDGNGEKGSELPEFTDVKMFVDSLLMEYQTNRQIHFELERNLMTCTPYRNDLLFTSEPILINTIVLMIDAVFILPYLVLLISLIQEKNLKVKEILKVLGIEPILNNIAQAMRTMIIFIILILFLSIAYKLKLKSDAYFNTVNFGIIFLGNITYALQLISFCIMNAQLFNTNIRAVIFTLVIYFVAYNIYSLTITWPSSVQYLLMFICPYIAGHSLFQQTVLYDLANKDVELFQSIYRFVPQYFPTLITMLLSSVFYWILSWYLEKIFPGEYGVPCDWNFAFKLDYWCREKKKSQISSFDNHGTILTRPATPLVQKNSMGTPVVHVDRLTKIFGPDRIAVNEVSFNLYDNQITSLLGPNGSGKTTIFNCLIGIYKQTSGTITMESENGLDYDTRNDIDRLRKSIGYCPQHDILFDLLTIEEQLQFYASARGFKKYKQQISNEMLHLVNLQNSKDTYCKSLSGGMKRRLSLACAFVGNTKIVLLDEPSSGLDPSNRRLLWDWLRKMKEGKTLLLTTHFMEESDALSDRIIIISNGVIKADGTSAILKEQYGSGYKLIINKQINHGTNEIELELRSYLPALTIESDILNGDIVFRTNQQPDNQFIEALRHLELLKVQNRIKSFGVQNSTMDDVFLKIMKQTNDENDSGSISINTERIDEKCRHIFNEREFFHGFRYYLSQLHGLIIKTLLVRYRRWGLTAIVVLLPIIYNLLLNVISHNANVAGTFEMKLSSLNPQTILYKVDSVMENYFQAAVESKSNGLVLEKRQESIVDMNRYIWQKRIDQSNTYTNIYLGFQISEPRENAYKIQALSSNLISGHEVVSVASNIVFKYALNDTSASIQTTLIYKKTSTLTIEPTIGSLMNILSIASCFLKLLPTSIILDVFVFYLIFFYTTIFLVSERKDSFLSLLNISGLHPAFYWITNYLFDIIISVIWFCYLLVIYCIFDISFNGTSNRRSESTSIIPIEFASSRDLRIQFYPLTIIIALPTLPFAYLITKLFKSDILAGLSMLFILMILHLVSIIVPIIMSLINNVFLQKLIYWLLNIFSPTINSQVIITYILAQQSKFCRTFFHSDFSFFTPIGNDTIGWNWIILIVHIIILLLLLIAIDSGILKFSFSCFVYPLHFDEHILDDDVLTERHRILNSNYLTANKSLLIANNSEEEHEIDHLTVNDLVKRFPGRSVCAVNHLTFGAKRGELFGLLGYNGAGKTTTFRILVDDELATQGSAYIDGQNVHHRLRSIRQLGYCPQENASMDFLTVEDSLYLLARIRGITSLRTTSVVQTISSLFLLDPFLKNYIHQLSGGTKRRLHAALALIGPPLVVILDEPTTGVDPFARQQMQEIFLNAVKEKLTIILTSHSMDECERVCDRLGIMYDGQLACLGTIQHLKSKFGHGYTIEIKVRSTHDDVNTASIHNVQSLLLSRTQWSVETQEITFLTGTFQIQQGTPADLFELLEQNKENLNIETYTISQTTLEQIFLSFGEKLLDASRH
ncbi:unnamed protein product [Rotaria magnacalcarata]|uniref:ABC transporter domain-containing protein n=2 Tax=Rotaria magnacalcarata TaxID=392030 RepID=A0A815E9E9_9BILA|nr:unnamed protein product [Rotaria magnacalcarata]